MSDPVTVKLKHPIQFGKDRLIDELTFRDGLMGDLKGIDINRVTMDAILVVAGRLCAQPQGVIERIAADDAAQVVMLVTDFLERCLTTGKTPSPS